MSVKDPAADDLPAVPWINVRPYVSVVVLECTADDPDLSFSTLQQILRKPGRQTKSRQRVVAASDLTRANADTFEGVGSLESLDIDHAYGFVRQKQAAPGWASADIEYVDVEHQLVLAVRCGRLVAVQADSNTIDRLQKKLDRAPLPPLRRVDSRVLEATFLTGEAKGLWLRQVQRPSKLRPSSRTTYGRSLGDTLDPIEDSSFALDSALVKMSTSAAAVFLKGSVGVTVRNSQLWFKATPDFPTYVSTVAEILTLAGQGMQQEAPEDGPFQYLAREVTDLAEMSDAIEVMPLQLDALPSASAGGSELHEAAAVLEGALLEVQQGTASDRFYLDVGRDGSVGGTLAVHLESVNGRFVPSVGYDPRAGEPLESATELRGLLDANDLLEIYYGSGHKYSGGRLWKQNYSATRFPDWDFRDFSRFDITQEKPQGLTKPQDIHAAINEDGDDSLFAWVVQTFGDGWLTCDDGPGEVADFVHLGNDDLLRVIHVKAAHSATAGRRVRATDYEVVASQASKNLIYQDRDRLVKRLREPQVLQPACWTDGGRVPNREEFLDMLSASRASGRTEVVIVQPHMSKRTYDRLQSLDESVVRDHNQQRLHLLEMLLNSARASVVRYGAELKVIASLE